MPGPSWRCGSRRPGRRDTAGVNGTHGAHIHDESGEDGIDGLLDQLRTRNVRVTVARRAVLEALLEAGDRHLSVDELADRVQRNHPTIHLSTIYRTVDSLESAGVITLARFADHPVTYHLAHDVHHHAVCSRCAAVLQLPGNVLDSLTRRLRSEYGFHAAPKHLTIPGLCADCVGD